MLLGAIDSFGVVLADEVRVLATGPRSLMVGYIAVTLNAVHLLGHQALLTCRSPGPCGLGASVVLGSSVRRWPA